jgi:hypothetical protein
MDNCGCRVRADTVLITAEAMGDRPLLKINKTVAAGPGAA